MSELSQQEVKEMRKLAKESLFFLARGVLGFDQVTDHFHMDVCSFLESDHKRKLLCLPRGFLKTTLGSKARPIQVSLQNPGVAQLIVCQQHDNARKILGDIRELWERNMLLRELFPELVPKTDRKWNSDEACLARPRGTFSQQESTYESAGIGTQLQSRHYDKIYADDLIVAKKDQVTGTWMQPSEEDIQKAIGWHQMTWGLLRNVKTSEYMQIMTRWCPNDLYDYLTKNEPRTWKVMLRGALDSSGEPLFPEKYSKEVLENILASQGMYKYSTQYLSSPVDDSSLIFKDLYGVYMKDEMPALSSFKLIGAACDPAIGQKRTNHPSAIAVGGLMEDGRRYVLDMFSGRVTPSELVAKIIQLWRKWRFKRFVVEVVAYQEALKYALEEVFHKEGGTLFRIVPVRPGTNQSKSARIEGMQPSFKAGWWYVRNDLRELREELDQYPFSTFRDSLDALAWLQTLFPPSKGWHEQKEKQKTVVNNARITYEEIMKSFETTREGSLAKFYDVQLAGRR